MNCQEVSEKIYQYCDGEVSPQECAKISLHLDKCPVCRHMCQLTLIENDILNEKDDIPQLSSGFTAKVISSLQSEPTALYPNQGRSRRFRGAMWLGSTIAAAAIVLFLYLPQFNVIENRLLNYPQNMNQEQYSVPQNSTLYDMAGTTGQVGGADSPETVFTDTETKVQIAENTEKPSAKTNSSNPPMVLSQAEPVPGINLGSVPNVNRSGSPDRATAEVSSSANNVRPSNIPDRLKFVQVNNSGGNTIYNYATLDGKEYLQLTIGQYNESPTEVKAVNGTPVLPPPLTVSRNMQIADKKVTVVFTGNLSLEEMNRLADTVQFPDTPTD